MRNHKFSCQVILNERGQGLILTVLIMLLLAVVAAIFVSVVSRNLSQAERHRDIVGAQYLAETAIRWADYQMTNSEEGADWRPPTGILVRGDRHLGDCVEIETKEGRFRLKIEYRPRLGDPLSKFIKITAKGLTGRREETRAIYRLLIAYKPIAITDYIRFITNQDKLDLPAELGVSWLDIDGDGTYAGDSSFEDWLSSYTGSIRANSNLVWHGRNSINLISARSDSVEVAGRIFHRDYRLAPNPDQQVELLVDGVPLGTVVESDNLNFSTYGGLYRDGLSLQAAGIPDYNYRWIRRLEPPKLNLPRYRSLSKRRGIYIDNADDVNQLNNIKMNNELLRNNWLRLGDPVIANAYWRNNIYVPPGVEIYLSNQPPYRIWVTRHDKPWDDNNDGLPEFPRDVPRPFYYARNPYLPYDPIDNPEIEPLVICAEGNIRIRGTIPPDKRLTVISGATIYIEGNILKGNNISALALLAKDNVCVNTSAFVISPWTDAIWESDAGTAQPPFHWLLEPNRSIWGRVTFGFQRVSPPYLYDPAGTFLYVPYLMMRHCGESPGPTSINLLVNNLPFNFNVTDPNNPVYAYTFNQFDPRNITIWQSNALSPFYEIAAPGYRWWRLTDYLNLSPGVDNWLKIQLDITSERNYWLSAFKIELFDESGNWQPLPGLDVVINALCYAETGSWFIIPGDWFDPTIVPKNGLTPNPPSSGTPEEFIRRARYNYRIVVNGAISENHTADIPSVCIWMDKWSYPIGSGPAGFQFGSIVYNYDDNLHSWHWEISPDTGLTESLPNLPNLPVSPDLIFWGERM